MGHFFGEGEARFAVADLDISCSSVASLRFWRRLRVGIDFSAVMILFFDRYFLIPVA